MKHELMAEYVCGKCGHKWWDGTDLEGLIDEHTHPIRSLACDVSSHCPECGAWGDWIDDGEDVNTVCWEACVAWSRGRMDEYARTSNLYARAFVRPVWPQEWTELTAIFETSDGREMRYYHAVPHRGKYAVLACVDEIKTFLDRQPDFVRVQDTYWSECDIPRELYCDPEVGPALDALDCYPYQVPDDGELESVLTGKVVE